MQNAIGEAIGTMLGFAIGGGVLTGIAIGFAKASGKPLSKTQKISTFVITSLLFVAGFMYNRFSG